LISSYQRSKTTAWQASAMENFFYVYVIVSEIDTSEHYTGITHDLSLRLKEHNQGACKYTTKYRPWKVETAVAFRSEAKARAFEKYLKSGSGREFARRHF
jgi:predicted GIY-YIG superfamily endonuclease